MKNIGRKLVGILILFSILTGSSVSCNKEKKTAVTPQNKILFTAKSKSHTNIVKLNTKTKVKEILAAFPMEPEDIIISPDQKKMAFKSRTENSGQEGFAIYTMNLNGTNFVNLTKFLTLPDFNCYFVDFCFSPDNQKIAVLVNSLNLKKESKQVIFLVNLDGKEKEVYWENEPKFSLMNQLFFEVLKSLKTRNNWSGYRFSYDWSKGRIKANTDLMEYLLFDSKYIGIYSWKKRSFTPIKEIINPSGQYDWSFSWSLDKKTIFYFSKDDDKKTHSAYRFDMSSKNIVKLTENFLDALYMLWQPDGKKIIYAELTKVISHPDSSHYNQYFYDLKEFDMDTNTVTKIISTRDVGGLFYLSDQKVLINKWQYESHWVSILNLKTKQIVDLFDYETFRDHFILDLNLFVLDRNLIGLQKETMYIYNTDKSQISLKYEITEKSVDSDSTPFGLTISPDRSMYYFANEEKLFVFSANGNLLFTDVLTPKNSEHPFNDPSFLLGFFSSPSEITYLEYVDYVEENMIENYEINLETKKATNLNQKLGKVKSIQVSPTQKLMAVLSMNEEKTDYFIDLVDLTNTSPPKRLVSFQKPEETESTLYLFTDKSLIYSTFWSPDSQYLYFISGGSSLKNNLNLVNTLVINRIKADGTELMSLTDPSDQSFQANVSPDGKQIVFNSSKDQLVSMMNKDGTKNKVIIQNEKLFQRYQPTWSPNSKLFTFYQMNQGDLKFQFVISNTKGKILKTIPIEVIRDPLINEKFHFQKFFSADSNYVAYIKNYQQEPFQSTLALLKDLKEEILLKGNIVSFHWSPTGNQIILLDSKNRYQFNKLSLYDCATNTYIPISQDIQQLFDACWSPDGKQILYAGTDSKAGQIVFKTSNPDGSNQKLLLPFGDNPLERPSSIEKIENLVWLK
jgi:Tol biopolymer transport system component